MRKEQGCNGMKVSFVGRDKGVWEGAGLQWYEGKHCWQGQGVREEARLHGYESSWVFRQEARNIRKLG